MTLVPVMSCAYQQAVSCGRLRLIDASQEGQDNGVVFAQFLIDDDDFKVKRLCLTSLLSRLRKRN